jgi:hypothetical protein
MQSHFSDRQDEVFNSFFECRLGLGQPFDFRQPDLLVNARIKICNQLLELRVD